MNKRMPNGYWTYEKCKEEALKYTTITQLQKQNGTVYTIIRKKEWRELLDHMETLQMPKDYWNYERCKEEALKYSNRSDLSENNGTVINVIRKNNWQELLVHMEYICKPSDYWTYEMCKEIALNYTSRSSLQKKDYAVYHAIHKNNWLYLLNHMEYVCRPAGYWTYEICEELAKKYSNWKEFIAENSAAYSAICKNKWQDKLGSHLVYVFKPNGYWTHERCKIAALKYTSISHIAESEDSGAYIAIKKKNWFELIEHFIESKKPNGYWDYERCKEDALKYTIRSDYAKKSPTAYGIINKNKWTELLDHMDFQDNIKTRYIYVF